MKRAFDSAPSANLRSLTCTVKRVGSASIDCVTPERKVLLNVQIANELLAIVVVGDRVTIVLHNQKWYVQSVIGKTPATGTSTTEVVVVETSSGVTSHDELTGVTADQHHSQEHVLADGSGLGADHTVSGLTVGQVFRALGATEAGFSPQVVFSATEPASTYPGMLWVQTEE